MKFQDFLSSEVRLFVWNDQKYNLDNLNVEELMRVNKKQLFMRALIHYYSTYGLKKTIGQRLSIYQLGKKYGATKFDINRFFSTSIGNESIKSVMKKDIYDFLIIGYVILLMLIFGLGYFCGMKNLFNI